MAADERTDSELGQLKWDDRVDWWEGEITLTSEQPFVLCILSRTDDKRVITEDARMAIARIRELETRCREYAADELLEIHNSEWSEGNPISKDVFVGRLSPECVVVHETGYAEICFEDGDLFWGHMVEIRIKPDGSFQEAVVAG